LAIDDDRTEVGAVTIGTDVLYRHFYALDLAYDFAQNSGVGSIDYVYDRWTPVFKLHAGRENVFSRDDNNDIRRVRAVDNAQAEVVLPWLTTDSRFSFHAAVVGVKEKDIDIGPGVPAKVPTTDELVGLATIWDSTQQFPLSISRSHGRELRLVAESSDVFDSDYTGQVYTFGWREFLPLGAEHVLAFDFAEGWGTDQPRPFQLGGSQGVASAPDVLGAISFDSPFNVRDYPLRGYPQGLAQLTGRRMQLATVEWRFPILRVERGFMAPPLALHQLSGTLFYEGGRTWDIDPLNWYRDAGIELNIDTALLYSVRMNVRLGYAHGFDVGGENRGYLQIGSSF
jgi:hypothetical protein